MQVNVSRRARLVHDGRDAVTRRWGTQEILGAIMTIDDETLPDDFLDVRTDEYRLLRYPDHLLSPTLPAAQVVWSNTSRPLGAVFDEVAFRVKRWGLDELHWWTSSTTRPLDTEEYLRNRGGVPADTYQILAYELSGGAIEASLVSEVDVELVCDQRTLRDALDVEARGWGRSSPEGRAVGVLLEETLRNLETSSEFRFLANVEGQPASTGILKMAGEVARLYGAVTLPEFRSRGCYRAVLRSRLREARELGATIAVTRGRPHASGRMLTTAGFTVHGEERSYRLSLR